MTVPVTQGLPSLARGVLDLLRSTDLAAQLAEFALTDYPQALPEIPAVAVNLTNLENPPPQHPAAVSLLFQAAGRSPVVAPTEDRRAYDVRAIVTTNVQRYRTSKDASSDAQLVLMALSHAVESTLLAGATGITGVYAASAVDGYPAPAPRPFRVSGLHSQEVRVRMWMQAYHAFGG